MYEGQEARARTVVCINYYYGNHAHAFMLLLAALLWSFSMTIDK